MRSRPSTALVVVALIACKADDPPPAPARSGSALAPPAAGSQRDESIAGRIGGVEHLMPAVDGAKVLQSRSPRDGYALAMWCIDQPDAIDRVKTALARDGWTDVRTRGKAEQLGIAASKGDARFSARAGKRDPRCAGTFVSATVMRLGKIDLQLQDGEKIR